MKKLSKLNEGVKPQKKLSVQSDSINYIESKDLKKYLRVADKFLSDAAKEVINYLIVNNKSYLSDLATDDEENVLAGFYNAGMPTTDNLKELWKCIDEVVKSGRPLEIPVFQTKGQFDKIIANQSSPDTVIMDFDSEKNRNEIAKRYEPLVHKICRQYHGKSNLSYEDLLASAYEGLTYAMNNFGKKRSNKDDINDETVNKYTFGQFAAYMIRFHILGTIENESRIVRISKSQQKKERTETGKISKNNSVSGDKQIGVHNSDEGNKTLFDFIDSQEYSDSSLDRQDLAKLWDNIYDKIKEKFGEKIFNIWCSFYGINGAKELKNKELADKYDVSNSSITYYCFKVNNYLQKDKEMFNMLQEVYELMKECLAEEDNRNNLDEPYHIKTNTITDNSITY